MKLVIKLSALMLAISPLLAFARPKLKQVGDEQKPLGAFPLGLCEGDCDYDMDCQNSLKCFKRSRRETVPGCRGKGQKGVDYCYKDDEAPRSFCPIGRTSTPTQYKIRRSGNRFSQVSYMSVSQQLNNNNPAAWVGSDGPQNDISAVDLKTGEIIRTYDLDVGVEKKSDDWETIALGACSSKGNSVCIYIGNTGNNDARRKCENRNCDQGRDKVKVYKFKEPDLSIPQNRNRILVNTLKLNYHDKRLPTNRADCEAMFVDPSGDRMTGNPGDIYLVTKFKFYPNLSRLVKVPVEKHEGLQPGRSITFSVEPVGKPFGERVWNGADTTLSGNLIAMRDTSRVYFFARPQSLTIAEALNNKPCPFTSKSEITGDKQYHETVAMMGMNMIEASECSKNNACDVAVSHYKLRYQ